MNYYRWDWRRSIISSVSEMQDLLGLSTEFNHAVSVSHSVEANSFFILLG